MCPPLERPPRASAAESVRTTELEIAVLRALCTQAEDDALHTQLVNALNGYHWEHADHRVIYEALIEINSWDRETLRRELPAAVTRMGFPDIHCERFFTGTATPISPDRIFELIRELKARVSGR